MAGPLVVAGFGFGLVVAPMVDAILTGVPAHDAGSASGQLSTIQQVGMALGVAMAGVIFFTLLASGSGRGVDAVAPGLHQQFTAAGVPARGQDAILAGFRACVHDRSAETDPTKVPASCLAGKTQAGPVPAQQIQKLLADAGAQANAHNFARTFSVILLYATGIMIAVFAGLFALPRRVRARNLDAELSAFEDHRVGQL
jgi:hypothetical protein